MFWESFLSKVQFKKIGTNSLRILLFSKSVCIRFLPSNQSFNSVLSPKIEIEILVRQFLASFSRVDLKKYTPINFLICPRIASSLELMKVYIKMTYFTGLRF